MDAFLREELERSLYVHFPLRVQEERAMETRLLKKKAEQEIILWDGSPEKIRGNGRGEAEISDGVLRMNLCNLWGLYSISGTGRSRF